jgi:hypothetical protein
MKLGSALMGAALLIAGPALAADEQNLTAGLSAAGAPLALHGYDAVAYFTQAKPVLGLDSLAVVHDGAAYRFATAEDRDAFKRDPAKYVPQYGGFCAFGVSVSKKFDGDPLLWTVKDGKLYLNLNQEIYAKFLEDVPGILKTADGNWPKIEHKAAAKL